MQEEARHGDDTLVEQAKNGDREAFGELVRRHRAKVYRTLHPRMYWCAESCCRR
jgi:DNA-directed RNA polymerase specialized sigma24 family protein